MATAKSSARKSTQKPVKRKPAGCPTRKTGGIKSPARPAMARTTAPQPASGPEQGPNQGKTSKAAMVLAMLQRPEGTTVAAICKATGWQPHSVRGFFTSVTKNRLGLNLVSAKVGNERVYHIADDGSAVRQVSRGSAGRAGARG